MGRTPGYLLELTIFCSVPFSSSEKSSSCNPAMWLADLSVTNAGTNSSFSTRSQLRLRLALFAFSSRKTANMKKPQ